MKRVSKVNYKKFTKKARAAGFNWQQAIGRYECYECKRQIKRDEYPCPHCGKDPIPF
jgi:hypothetical protein